MVARGACHPTAEWLKSMWVWEANLFQVSACIHTVKTLPEHFMSLAGFPFCASLLFLPP